MSIHCDLIFVCWINTCPGFLCCCFVKFCQVCLSSENYFFLIFYIYIFLYVCVTWRLSRFLASSVCHYGLDIWHQCLFWESDNGTAFIKAMLMERTLLSVDDSLSCVSNEEPGSYWNIINRIIIYVALCLVPARYFLWFNLNRIIPFYLFC